MTTTANNEYRNVAITSKQDNNSDNSDQVKGDRFADLLQQARLLRAKLPDASLGQPLPLLNRTISQVAQDTQRLLKHHRLSPISNFSSSSLFELRGEVKSVEEWRQHFANQNSVSYAIGRAQAKAAREAQERALQEAALVQRSIAEQQAQAALDVKMRERALRMEHARVQEVAEGGWHVPGITTSMAPNFNNHGKASLGDEKDAEDGLLSVRGLLTPPMGPVVDLEGPRSQAYAHTLVSWNNNEIGNKNDQGDLNVLEAFAANVPAKKSNSRLDGWQSLRDAWHLLSKHASWTSKKSNLAKEIASMAYLEAVYEEHVQHVTRDNPQLSHVILANVSISMNRAMQYGMLLSARLDPQVHIDRALLPNTLGVGAEFGMGDEGTLVPIFVITWVLIRSGFWEEAKEWAERFADRFGTLLLALRSASKQGNDGVVYCCGDDAGLRAKLQSELVQRSLTSGSPSEKHAEDPWRVALLRLFASTPSSAVNTIVLPPLATREDYHWVSLYQALSISDENLKGQTLKALRTKTLSLVHSGHFSSSSSSGKEKDNFLPSMDGDVWPAFFALFLTGSRERAVGLLWMSPQWRLDALHLALVASQCGLLSLPNSHHALANAVDCLLNDGSVEAASGFLYRDCDKNNSRESVLFDLGAMVSRWSTALTSGTTSGTSSSYRSLAIHYWLRAASIAKSSTTKVSKAANNEEGMVREFLVPLLAQCRDEPEHNWTYWFGRICTSTNQNIVDSSGTVNAGVGERLPGRLDAFTHLLQPFSVPRLIHAVTDYVLSKTKSTDCLLSNELVEEHLQLMALGGQWSRLVHYLSHHLLLQNAQNDRVLQVSRGDHVVDLVEVAKAMLAFFAEQRTLSAKPLLNDERCLEELKLTTPMAQFFAASKQAAFMKKAPGEAPRILSDPVAFAKEHFFDFGLKEGQGPGFRSDLLLPSAPSSTPFSKNLTKRDENGASLLFAEHPELSLYTPQLIECFLESAWRTFQEERCLARNDRMRQGVMAALAADARNALLLTSLWEQTSKSGSDINVYGGSAMAKRKLQPEIILRITKLANQFI